MQLQERANGIYIETNYDIFLSKKRIVEVLRENYLTTDIPNELVVFKPDKFLGNLPENVTLYFYDLFKHDIAPVNGVDKKYCLDKQQLEILVKNILHQDRPLYFLHSQVTTNNFLFTQRVNIEWIE
jgi:hypothetical protein